MSDLLGLNEEKETTGNDSTTPSGFDPAWEATAKSGANWFYWIAGLSLVNSLAFVFGANFSFLAGLGITQVVEALIVVSIENGAPSMLKGFAIAFDVVVFGVFALLGYYANKLFTVAFVIGIVAYVIDGALVLAVGSIASAAFHAFALFFIVRGFLACRNIKKFQQAPPIQSPPPPPVFG
ncbi:MAG TPA: hypothetical protein PKA82_01935 [Pyrinomonadaceae bacterium]|nr:hypothetical protein [Pyrinomonadaceae bacterium]